MKYMELEIRPGTYDGHTVQSVLSGREYRDADLRPGDVVLDIGAHVGSFAVWAIRKGARRVHSYEANPETYALARRNLTSYDDVDVRNRAVVGTVGTRLTRNFWLNPGINRGLDSLVEKRGRTAIRVLCVPIDDLPETDFMKMDVEGAEIELLAAMTRWPRSMAIEFHHAHLNDIKTHEKYHATLELLRENFRTVDAREDTGGTWATVIHCRD